MSEKKEWKKPRQYSMVIWRDWYIKELKKHNMNALLEASPFIYLGEIVNMPGHCIVISHGSGKVYSGYHIEDFQELTEEET